MSHFLLTQHGRKLKFAQILVEKESHGNDVLGLHWTRSENERSLYIFKVNAYLEYDLMVDDYLGRVIGLIHEAMHVPKEEQTLFPSLQSSYRVSYS
jgi:hypothetical protein